ncbi:MAG: sigma-54-dependent transcriptional regulator [Methylibium sp.]
MPGRILIVEDDSTLRLTLQDFLTKQGFGVISAETGEAGLALAQQSPFDLMLVDLRLPDMSGLDVIKRWVDAGEEAVMVMMTAYPEVRTAVAAIKAGAYDYINKPFDLEDLRGVVTRALEVRQLRREVAWRRVQAADQAPAEMVGASAAFRQLVATTQRIAAAARVPVLILGESGTGKEHIAQAIHRLSPRAGGPWVTVNCSALPEGLLEAEMFGHEKGAFTDARQARKGLLELADGGTLFLDEIGDMALALQPKLLRAIETQTFRRIGSQKETHVDVRFVAATHRDLPAMVAQGSFRQDLYYRLNVGTIEVPPLRERQDDIEALAAHFLARFAPTIGCPATALSDEARRSFVAYRWPGNVRELRNVIERALILCDGPIVHLAQLPREIVGALPTGSDEIARPALSEAADLSLAAVERHHIQRVLDHCHGNKTRAAEVLGISRLTLRNRLGAIGLPDEG